jgi:hypothetical protein
MIGSSFILDSARRGAQILGKRLATYLLDEALYAIKRVRSRHKKIAGQSIVF